MKLMPIKSFFNAYSKLSLLILGAFLTACQSSIEADSSFLGTDYYPLSSGLFIDYEVEIIEYSLSAPPVFINYQLRERIDRTFRDADNDIAYRLERFKRSQARDPWELDSIWSVKRTPQHIRKTEDNYSFIKLGFPAQNGLTWNGNNFNNFSEQEYLIRDFKQAFQINDFNFDRSLTVSQKEDCNLVSLDYQTETFAEDIGLVFKTAWRLSFDLTSTCIDQVNTYCESELMGNIPPTPNPDCIEFGRIYTQKIINYGNSL